MDEPRLQEVGSIPLLRIPENLTYLSKAFVKSRGDIPEPVFDTSPQAPSMNIVFMSYP